MRDLADPQNPYAGQYAAWDEWYFANALRPSQRGAFNWATAGKEPGFVMESIQVDEQGFILPRLELERRSLAQLRDLKAYLNRPSCVCAFSAAGAMPPELKAAQEQARLSLWAEALPAIPQWLAESASLAILLPDGRGITTGLPSNADYNSRGMLVYRLHDADGALLAEAAPGLGWQDLFSPGYTEKVIVGAAKAGCRTVLLNGYAVWLDNQSNAVQAVYDYDGAALPLDTDTAARPGGLVTTIYPDMLKQVRAVQQGGD